LLNHPTLDLLADLGLHGMAKGFRDLADNPEGAALGHAEWLGILLEREGTLRQQKRFESRAKHAKLRQLAAVEDVDYRTPRGLDRTMFLKLTSCDWVRERHHCLLTGPTGVGKSWLACALGYKACRDNLSVLYHRVPRLFAALALARGDGRYAKLLQQLARVDLLIPGRLGTGAADRRATARSARDRRGPLQRWVADHHQPAADRPLARHRRQPNPGRRDPRPHPAQRAPHRAQGRKHAQTPRRLTRTATP
jgi:hypothetical protein